MLKSTENNYIKRLKNKKEDALEFVVDKYLSLVKAGVYKVLGAFGQKEVIEECINDIFLAVWEHSDQFTGTEEEFKKWIYTITKYKAIDCYRKIVKQKEVSIEENKMAGEERSAEEIIVEKEEIKGLMNQITNLSELDQKIVVMKYFLGIPSEFIGQKLGLSRTAVDNRIYRAKRKLNQHINAVLMEER